MGSSQQLGQGVARPRLTMHDVHLAIKLRCVVGVAEAVSRDVSLDVNQLLFGASALSLSLYYDCREAFQLLIDRHVTTSPVDLNQLSSDAHKRREPALVTAVRLDNHVAVCRLLDVGADLDVVDSFGHTALWTAARDRRFSIAVTLLCRGATVRPSSRAASLPVMAASRPTSRRTDVTQLLLLAGADDVNDDAVSLLARLLAPGRRHVVRLLLAACHVTVTSRVTSRDEDVDSLLREYVSRPASLQANCRWTLRRVVTGALQGRRFLPALSRLPLPRQLRDYVALMDVVPELTETSSVDSSVDWTDVIERLMTS